MRQSEEIIGQTSSDNKSAFTLQTRKSCGIFFYGHTSRKKADRILMFERTIWDQNRNSKMRRLIHTYVLYMKRLKRSRMRPVLSKPKPTFYESKILRPSYLRQRKYNLQRQHKKCGLRNDVPIKPKKNTLF